MHLTRPAGSMVLAALLVTAPLGARACADRSMPRVVLGTTHTVEDSGLLDELSRAWADDPDHDPLSVVVAGSGEVLMMARRGDVDVVLSHSPAAEIAFVEEGAGTARLPVMRSEFLLLGPPVDPVGADSLGDPVRALARIAERAQPFVSRADDSGTHARELELWQRAHTTPSWPDYIEAGTGMADALRLASQRRAYILADRPTFEMMRDELDLRIVSAGGAELSNPYSVLLVTNARNPEGARHFAEWIRGETAQRLIADYGRTTARPALFTPAADTTEG